MSQQHVTRPARELDGTFETYTYGFVYSIMLTLTAYLIVTHHLFNNTLAMLLIAGLAFCQLVVQLLLFLHLGREAKPRWKLAVFGFMVVIVLILVGGSLWIMKHLTHYNHLAKPGENSQQFIIRDEGIKH